MKRIILLTGCLSLFSITSFAQQAPPDNLVGDELKAWLKTNWYDSQHTELGYNAAREAMYSNIDKQSDGEVYGVYTGFHQTAASTTYLNPINAEHTVPQSFFNEAEPMRSDIFHLYPTHEIANSARSNFPFSEIDDVETDIWYGVGDDNELDQLTSTPTNELIDTFSELDGMRFEPREDHKGDVARAIFYYFTMYPNTVTGGIERLVIGDLTTLYDWHIQDPVSTWELQRNQRIKEIQGNENPFIVYPQLACRAYLFDCVEGTGSIALSASTLDIFALTAFGKSSEPQSFNISATEATNSLQISVSDNFELSLSPEGDWQTSVTVDAVNGSIAETTVYVRFTPNQAYDGVVNGYVVSTLDGSQAILRVSGEEGELITRRPYITFEDFDECPGSIGSQWTSIDIASNKGWTCTTSGYGDSKAIEMNGYLQDVLSDDWLVSGPIDLTSNPDAKLSFYSQYKFGTDNEELTLLYSKDFNGTDVEAATWTELSFQKPSQEETYTNSGEIDLGTLGGTIHLAFHYVSNEAPRRWRLDELAIYNDFSLLQLDNTTSNTLEEGESLTFNVTLNKASSAATEVLFDVTGTALQTADYTINGGTLNGSVLTVLIPAGQISASVTIVTLFDDETDNNESLTLRVSDLVGDNVVLDANARQLDVVITDYINPQVSILGTNAVNIEEGTSQEVIISLTKVNNENTEISLIISGSASNATDYTINGGTSVDGILKVTIPAGETSAKITVVALDDETEKETEDIIIALSSVSGGRAELNASASQITINLVEKGALGLDQPILRGVATYPNPVVNGRLTISGLTRSTGLQIISLSGRLVYQETLVSDRLVELPKMAAGLYIIKLQNKEGVYTNRLVIK